MHIELSHNLVCFELCFTIVVGYITAAFEFRIYAMKMVALFEWYGNCDGLSGKTRKHSSFHLENVLSFQFRFDDKIIEFSSLF